MFEIEIKGSGTKSEIIESLQGIIDSLNNVSTNDEDAILDGAEWEDATLFTTIKAN